METRYLATYRLICLALALSPSLLPAAEFKRVYRHGDPVPKGEKLNDRRVDFAFWGDKQTIVFASPRELACLSQEKGELQWSVENKRRVWDWSYSRGTKRLAILYTSKNEGWLGGKRISIIDCATGQNTFDVNGEQLAKLLGTPYFVPTCVALAEDGRLIVCDYERQFGRNGYVFDSTYQKVLSAFDIDASPDQISLSPDGSRVAAIADVGVVSVRDARTNAAVYFEGRRIMEAPKNLHLVIGPPFLSHVRHDGDNTLVYTMDGGCFGIGEVFVRDLAAKRVAKFGGRNGHIEMDVSFAKQWIALTGTSTDLALLDFEGKVIAEIKKATTRRNSCVEFSPSSDRVLVVSYDGTLSVFAIEE